MTCTRRGRLHAFRILVAIAALMPPALAAADVLPAPPQPAPVIETAPVVIDGETLFELRGISSLVARDRAAAVAARIVALARDPSFSTGDIRVIEVDNRTEIMAGDLRIVSVLDMDALVEQATQRDVIAGSYRTSIVNAIERFRLERSAPYLRRQAIHALLAIALLAGLLVAARWGFQRLVAFADRRLLERLRSLEARSSRILSADQIKNAWHGALRAVHLLLSFVLAFAFLDYVLTLFPWTRPIARGTAALFIDPLGVMWRGFIDSVPGLAFIAILVVVTRYALRLAGLFFDAIAIGRIQPSGFDPEWALPTFRLVRLAILGFALVIAYPYVPGSSTDAFRGVSIFFGLLMSIGAASMVGNSLAGYTLIYRRAFKIGDRIKIDEVVGDVVAMRQQVTHVRTPKNEEVTIPSSMIVNSSVVNYSSLARQGGLILHTTVGIGYETPWRQVEAMLIEAANRTEGLLREPPPFVLMTGLGEFNVKYEINVYCDRPQEMPRLYTALHQNILDIFNMHGVQIMTPSYEGDPEAPKVVPKERWFNPPAKPPAGS